MDYRIKFQKEALEEIDYNISYAAKNMNMSSKHLFSEWELEFIESIRPLINREVKLSHKQYSILQELSRKHHFKGISK